MLSKSFFIHLYTLLAFTAISAASIHKRSFAVERVPNPNYTGKNGPRALIKTYRKYGMPLPQGLLDALDAQDKQNSQPEQRDAVRSGKRVSRHFDRDRSKRARGNSDALAALLSSGLGAGNRNNQGSSQTDSQQQGPGAGGVFIQIGGLNTNSTQGANEQTGSVAANPEQNDVEFLSPVKIGGQTLNLDFDTGSSDLWVFNTQLDANSRAGHRLYDPASSSTFALMQGSQFRIIYGDNSGAEGNVGTDSVDVGGAVVPAQPIELATAVSAQFVKDQNTDGLMGLAFSKLNTIVPQKQKTFFDNVMPTLAEPLFTADLRKNAAGTYTFGAVDKSKFQGDLAWIPVNTTNGFWQFSSERFAINGGQVQDATPGGQAIADTGTTLLLADAKIVQAYYAQVQGAQNNTQLGGFTFPCNAQMPDLNLDVGGVYMAKVAGADINFAQVGNGGKSFLSRRASLCLQQKSG